LVYKTFVKLLLCSKKLLPQTEETIYKISPILVQNMLKSNLVDVTELNTKLNKETNRFKDNLVIKINKKEDLDKLILPDQRIKGIQLKLSLLKEVKQLKFNYYSIIVDNNVKHLIVSFDNLKKGAFVEILLPLTTYRQINDQQDILSKVNRVIIELNNQEQIKQLNEIFSDLILKKFYPFTKGVPFCQTQIEHCWELFNQQNIIITKKAKECQDCLLTEYCNYQNNNQDSSQNQQFEVKPIKEIKPELINFLKDENTATRF